MTRPPSSPTAPILTPIGRPLGRIMDEDGSVAYQVALGDEVRHLKLADAVVWLALHQNRPGTSRGIDLGLLQALELGDRGVTEPAASLPTLRDAGLVVELEAHDPAARREFGDAYQLRPLQAFYGNRPERLTHFQLAAAGRPTESVDAALHRVIVDAARCTSLAEVCEMDAGAVNVLPGHEDIESGADLLGHTIDGLAVLLNGRCVYLDRAADPPASATPTEERREPPSDAVSAAEQTGEDQPGDLFAVGFQAGFHYRTLGLVGFDIRLGEQVESIRHESSALVWVAAHGVPVDEGVDDSPESICEMAYAAGSPVPQLDLDDLIERGLVLRTKDAAAVTAFAAQHRAEPMLAGVGNDPDNPADYWLGAGEDSLLVKIDHDQYSVWRDACQSHSLLDAAAAAGRAGSADELRSYLRDVQALCARQALYIDQVRV